MQLSGMRAVIKTKCVQEVNDVTRINEEVRIRVRFWDSVKDEDCDEDYIQTELTK